MASLPPVSNLVSNDPTEAAPTQQVPTAQTLVEENEKPVAEAKSDKTTAIFIAGALIIFWMMW